MTKIDINEIPTLEFDAGIPDTSWGETTTSSVNGIIGAIVAFLSH